MASTSARLTAWTERYSVAAAELRDIMEESEREARELRRAAGRASAAVRTGMYDHLQDRALRLAVEVRQADPAASLRAVAAEVTARLGASAPSVRTVRRWAAAWEKTEVLGP